MLQAGMLSQATLGSDNVAFAVDLFSQQLSPVELRTTLNFVAIDLSPQCFT